MCVHCHWPPVFQSERREEETRIWKRQCSQCMSALATGLQSTRRLLLVSGQVRRKVCPRPSFDKRGVPIFHALPDPRSDQLSCIAAARRLSASPLLISTASSAKMGLGDERRLGGVRKRNVGGLAAVSIGGLCALFPLPGVNGYLSAVRVPVSGGLRGCR